MTPNEGRQEKPARRGLGPLVALLPFVRRYRGRVIAALVALVAAAAATLAVPVAVRRIIDVGFSGADAVLVDRYFLVMIAVVAVLALASAARYHLVTTLGERVVADLRTAVFDHLTRLSPAFYAGERSGEIVSRLTADATLIKSAFGTSASVALRNLVLFVGAVIMMVATSPRLSAFVLVAIPLIVLPLVAFGRAVRRRSRAAQDSLADTSAFAAEAIGAMWTVQTFTAEPEARSRFAKATEEAYGAAARSIGARAMLTATIIFLVFSSVVAILWFGATDVLEGRMTGGTLGQFVLFAVLGASSLGELSQVWGELSQAAGAAERLDELLSTRPEIVDPPAPKPMPARPRGRVVFDKVCFAYPGRVDRRVVREASFAVEPGQSVALVGPSGAGKTTILQLLQRGYDVDSGRVEVDGVDVREAALAELRGRIAVVPQDPVIFAASIADNVRFGRPRASDAEVRRALEDAAAAGFVDALPEGAATLVGERGVTLSGGQRQRLAIARAILKDAPILLLDEATSALDSESETLVQRALEQLMAGRTTLVVAHRLATVLKADRILVMDDGRIVEDGGHAELVARGGLYARLARLQFGFGSAEAAEKTA